MNWITKFISTPARAAVRSQQIGYLLSRHGVAGGLASLGFEIGRRGLIQTHVISGKRVALDSVFGKNLALTCIKLGPTFIKLGQMLATRPDVVGDAVSEELKILFDRVPPISFSKIEKILKEELGKKKLKERFKKIDPRPLASASLAQTHCATLTDGTAVILKVQKENTAELVKLDLILLEGFSRSVHLVYPGLGIATMFQDFKRSTLQEIDYREEAKNIDRFQNNYKRIFASSDVVFPGYYADLTTEKVITLEPMRGKKISDLKKGSTVARKAAEVGLAAVLEQIFDHGFFHADPHSGNLFFQEDAGRIGFIDLGMVGQLHPEDKKKFLRVVLAILKRDRKSLSQSLFELGEHGKGVDFKKFDAAVQEILDDMKSKGVDNIRLDQMVNKVLASARKNRIFVPNRYVMMIRSCLMIEGVAKSLNPNLSVMQVALPIVTKSLLKSYNPFRIFWRD